MLTWHWSSTGCPPPQTAARLAPSWRLPARPWTVDRRSQSGALITRRQWRPESGTEHLCAPQSFHKESSNGSNCWERTHFKAWAIWCPWEGIITVASPSNCGHCIKRTKGWMRRRRKGKHFAASNSNGHNLNKVWASQSISSICYHRGNANKC